ncbi:MAG: hypothetical protein HYU63_06970 [Armatimonadetes bacterium]|nr:hypothetical protein [Armatimonadota bacterium]
MSEKILKRTLNYLKEFYKEKLNSIKIIDIFIENPFTIIKLNTNLQGIAMNYQNSSVFNEGIPAILSSDPLLINYFTAKKEFNLNDYSLLTALLSALSQEFLNSKFLKKFNLNLKRGAYPLSSFAKSGDSITIIGFGGFLNSAIMDKNIKNIYVADLYCKDPSFKQHFKKELEKYNQYLKNKSLFLHDGSDNEEIIKKSEIVCITGSTLCNGTIDKLLKYSRNCREIIIQGHSATILPLAFFEEGVTFVVQTLIDIDILSLAKRFQKQRISGEQSLNFGDFLDIILPSTSGIYKD